jgi:3-hydroxypropanoate dehydrogenase
MATRLDTAALATLFLEARSYNRWSDTPVSDAILHELYELLKWGPTSLNTCPARFTFVRTASAKQRLLSCVSEGNLVKVQQAPVTVIVAMDTHFYEKIPELFPSRAAAVERFRNAPVGDMTMMRNATLQGGYLILAARALGLDCGPMSGFDNAKLDAEFYGSSTWKSNFICALGHGSTDHLYPRNPRLSFETACQML